MCLCPQQVPTRPTTSSPCTLREMSASHLLVSTAQHSNGGGAAQCSSALHHARQQGTRAACSESSREALHCMSMLAAYAHRAAPCSATVTAFQHKAPCTELVAPTQQLMHRQHHHIRMHSGHALQLRSSSQPNHAMPECINISSSSLPAVSAGRHACVVQSLCCGLVSSQSRATK